MDLYNNIYLSLGSNQGDTLEHLQNAIKQIAERIGLVLDISSIYKTEAIGFSGDDFMNICIKVQTRFAPQELLQELLKIENSLGRKRKKSSNYESRIIDIDILFIDNKIINSAELKIPHPEINNRQFVLTPLSEIAPNLLHPIHKESIKTLQQNCSDTSKIERLAIRISKPLSIADKYNYIAIEGNIGAGKTTLSNMLAQDYNAKQVLERFADNPFLPKFYEDNDRFAFPLEMSFLADRYQQLTDDLAQFDLFKSFIISDYYIFKSLIFAQVTLAYDEYSLYRRMFDIMYNEITKPDLYIYLYQNTERLLENIKKRGRDYEQNISGEYLQKIHKGYTNFIQSESTLNTIIIDVSELDFVENKTYYQSIIQQIISYKPKV